MKRRASGKRYTHRDADTPAFWAGHLPQTWIAVGLIASLLMLGGVKTDPSLQYAVEFFLGLGLLALLLLQGKGTALGRMPVPVSCLAVALFALPAIQLVPLPPAWVQSAPGIQPAVAIRALAGQGDAWLPLTLTPDTTAQVLFSLVILLGVFVATLSADARGLRLILSAVLAVEMLTIVTGVLQLTSGGRLFNFYDSSHRFNLIGFFVNRNHTAVFLDCAIPIAVAFLTTGRHAPRRSLFVATGVVGAAVLIAVFGTVSRAGLVLTVVSFLLTLLFLVPFSWAKNRLSVAAVAVGASLFGFLLFGTTAVSRVFDRYADVGDDLRWRFYLRTWALVPKFLPWGGGLGSFVPIYNANEPLSDIKPTYVNNAHNDFLEILLEGGVLGGALALAVVMTVLWYGWRMMRRPPSAERSFALAGLIVMVLFLLHSMVDYPLRRLTCAELFAVALALLVRPFLRQAVVSSRKA